MKERDKILELEIVPVTPEMDREKREKEEAMIRQSILDNWENLFPEKTENEPVVH